MRTESKDLSAAEYRWWRFHELPFQSPDTPNPQSPIPSHSFLLSNFKVSLLNRFAPHAIMSTSSIYIFIDIAIYKEDPYDH